MHEYSIAQALVDQIEEIARRNQAGCVTRVVVQVGRLRGIVPEILQWGFEIVAAGTVAEGAQLAIEEIPIVVRCQACNAQSELDWPIYLCSACQSPAVTQLSGNELILKTLEIADDTDPSP